jgi:8-oxo-dGTP pyrophosphatase MutT (NUDIX family)
MVKKCICGTCIVLNDQRVLLLWHKKLNAWLPPGGHTEQNETPQETAIRETLEETGFHVRILNPGSSELITDSNTKEMPKPLAIMYEGVRYEIGEHEHFDMVYLAELDGNENSSVEDHEKTELRWFGEEDISSLDTFDNVKEVLQRAFEVAKASK